MWENFKKKLCKEKNIEVYSTPSDTKAIRKGYKTQFTDKVFDIMAISTKKNLQLTSSKISKNRKKFWENFKRKSQGNVEIKYRSFFEMNFYRSAVMDSFI